MTRHGGCFQVKQIKTTAFSRWFLCMGFLLILGSFVILNVTTTTAQAASCTFSSTSTEYYVAANTTQDISGCGGDKFCPASSVTREQLFVFLNRAATKTVY